MLLTEISLRNSAVSGSVLGFYSTPDAWRVDRPTLLCDHLVTFVASWFNSVATTLSGPQAGVTALSGQLGEREHDTYATGLAWEAGGLAAVAPDDLAHDGQA